MKANELRINNLVLHPKYGSDVKVPIKVSHEIIASLVEGGLHSQDIEPIPLTEEWLEKLGFSQEDDNIWSKGSVSINKDVDDTFYGSVFIQGGHVSFVDSVNKLQNLYFALTGSELEIV